MKTREDYERALRVVRGVVHRWDPYGLLAGLSPRNEFDQEIAAVVTQIPHIQSKADAAQALSRVFSAAFEPTEFRPEDCTVPGIELYEALAAAGLLGE